MGCRRGLFVFIDNDLFRIRYVRQRTESARFSTYFRVT